MPASLGKKLLFRFLLALAVLAPGCGDDGTSPTPKSTEPEVVTPGRLEFGPMLPTARVGATVPTPAVMLRDTKGRPIAGATVSFEVTAGGGSIERTTSLTAADGSASPGNWLLGPRPGSNSLEARSAGVPAAAAVVTTVVGPPAALRRGSAGTPRGVVGQLLEPGPAVLVEDAFGNPVAGVAVAFAPAAGHVAQTSGVTDANGLARPAWTLGPTPGTQTLAVVLDTLTVTLSAEAVPGPAASMQLLAGDGQTAAVATAVTVPPSVQVRDAFGNAVAGTAVQFTVAEGAGQVAGAATTTDAAGVAHAGAWTLGTRTGTNRLTASATGLPPVSFTATATPGAPDALAKLAGDAQTGTAGQLLPVPPTVGVSDSHGNPVPNVEVTFTAAAGTLSGGTTLTDAAGVARLAAWRLGPLAGPQVLEARAAGLLATFTATATPGAPAVVEVVAGQNQSALIGSAVPVRPAVRVRDAGGNAVPATVVRFAVTVGGGSVSGSTVLTGEDGTASVGGWTLGTTAGANRLTASVTGATTAIFNATALTGPPTRIVKAAGDGQSVLPGTPVPLPPTVRVTDSGGNPVAGVTVTFLPSAGSTVTGETQVTAANGTASVGAWVVAADPGVNTLTASAAGVGSVTFQATGVEVVPPPPEFRIELVYLTAVTTVQRQAFEQSVARWQEMITADVPDYRLQAPADACGAGSPAIDQVVDDLIILVRLEPIDGLGAVLGSAGPCYIRPVGGLPLLGRMRLDVADVDALAQSGRLADVVLHEMGHVLGIGTLWNTLGLLEGAGGEDPRFTGAAARTRFVLAGGSSLTGVPVENTGGAGTRDSHWRETVFKTELMTGWLSASGPNPLSAVTIGSLADLGYSVDYTRADSFSLLAALGFELDAGPVFWLAEERLPPPRIAR